MTLQQYRIIYQGSVKDLLELEGTSNDTLIFKYTDAYSIFDWGRMPDHLPGKGRALAALAAWFFEKLADPTAWRALINAQETESFIKASGNVEAAVRTLRESLAQEGLRTHYLGCVTSLGEKPVPLSELSTPFECLAVRKVHVARPRLVTSSKCESWDYSSTLSSPLPRLVPLEVIFRFSCPPGSSLISRSKKNPDYLASLPIPLSGGVEPGLKWDFPVIELFTKLEPSDRWLSFGEALEISGLSSSKLRKLLLSTAWVAFFLKQELAQYNLELADGKLEWGLDASGGIFLVDAIGPDELRILKNGIQLSKELLRAHYRTSHWYAEVELAKINAEKAGIADWKKNMHTLPEHLPPDQKELASQVYLALARTFVGEKLFPDAWVIDQLVRHL